LENLRETLRVREERAILVAAILSDGQKSDDLSELTALAKSAGAVVVDRFQQRIRSINPAVYIGRGKAEQLRERVVRFRADVVIFDNDLSPRQIRELEKIVQTRVLDRSELILDIFASRAKTKQAKLQVELAQLEYTYPRLTRMWSHLDSIAGAGGATAVGAVGGIGTRGMGEKQLEVDRRLVQKRVTELKRRLAKIDKRKLQQIDGRGDMFRICLVGYTNAGKSTLLNTLTDARVTVEDRLFATIDTRTKKWKLSAVGWALLSDTVGFVRNLPHHLIASFKATLEEVVSADLLLHVVDVSVSEALSQIESVNTVLGEIGCGLKPALKVFNKLDRVRNIRQLDMLRTIFADAVCISARTGLGVDRLKEAVAKRYRGDELLLRVSSLQSNGKVQSFLRAYGTAIKEQYSNGRVLIDARLGRKQLAQLKRLRPERLEVIQN